MRSSTERECERDKEREKIVRDAKSHIMSKVNVYFVKSATSDSGKIIYGTITKRENKDMSAPWEVKQPVTSLRPEGYLPYLCKEKFCPCQHFHYY